jgi:hypothetical protein
MERFSLPAILPIVRRLSVAIFRTVCLLQGWVRCERFYRRASKVPE